MEKQQQQSFELQLRESKARELMSELDVPVKEKSELSQKTLKKCWRRWRT